jgi:hypothetical protein
MQTYQHRSFMIAIVATSSFGIRCRSYDMQAHRNAWWVSFAAVLVVLLLPLFLTDILPLLD